MKFISLYFLLMVLCFTACSSKDDEDVDIKVSDGTVTFGVDITGFATRASQDGNSWSNDDRIGAFMFEAGLSQPLDNSTNILYTASEDGRSVTFTSETPLMLPKDGKPVEFVAYYPYNAQVQDFMYPVQLADQQAGSSSCDLMYAVSDKEYAYHEATASHIPLTFTHQLTKVILKFVDKDNRLLNVGDAVIQGMQAGASFDLKSAKLTPEGTTVDISTYRNKSNGFYEAVVLPSAIVDTFIVSFMSDGKACEWQFTNTNVNLPELRKGSQYIFTIQVVAGVITGPAVVETIEEGNSSFPWGDGETTSGTAEAIVYELFPKGETAFADTELKIDFNGPVPALGRKGYIRIYGAADNMLVDEINMSERQVNIEDGKTLLNSWMDIVGVTPKSAGVNRKRVVNYHPVRVEGNTVIIKPHSQRLQYNTSYYVTIDKTCIDQPDFTGIYANRWVFTTKPKPEPQLQDAYKVRVSHTDAAADFYSLQGAIDYFAANVDRHLPKEILLDNGVYKEIIYLRDQDNITIRGADRDRVSIQYDNRNEINGGVNDGMDISQFAPLGTPVNSGNRSVMTIGGDADKIRFENVTIENTSGNRGQAEAIVLRNNGGSAAFINCNFYGYQDTILSGGGYNWFYNCLVTGATDFIWGCGDVSLYEKCEIRAINNGRALQARVTPGKIGYVFLDSRFTVGEGVTGKSLLISSYEPDNITFLNTTFSDVFVNEYKENGVTLQPAVPSLSTGCKMYNCTNESGTDIFQLIPENKGIKSIYNLSRNEYDQHFGSRSIIMNGYDNAGGAWFK